MRNPTCKNCGLPEDEITGPCESAPTHEIIDVSAVEPSAAEPPSNPAPLPPEDPLERALWDLMHAVQEVPATEAVPTCTRAVALAAVFQARALREIADHVEDFLLPMGGDIIQRALITRIEHLEADAGHARAIFGEIWRELFGTACPGYDKARETILQELKRRGVFNGKASE
jgi:hypothetical protein